MQGVELVNRLLLGEPEQTIGIKYESTLDGRNAARTSAATSPAAATRARRWRPSKVHRRRARVIAPGATHSSVGEIRRDAACAFASILNRSQGRR